MPEGLWPCRPTVFWPCRPGGLGGSFWCCQGEAGAGSFKSADRHYCVAGDFNADGLQDIFCSVGADRGTAVKSNELYIQPPDHTFTEQAYQWDVTDPLARGRYSAVLDANNDGYPDIFAGSAALRPDGMPAPNRLYLNTGHGSMLDSPAMGLDLNIGSGCARSVDYDSDGWPDLLVCGRYDTGPLGLHLYRNDQGHGFQDVSSILGPPVAAEDAVMADVNHDSRPDLITLTAAKLAERLQRADGTFAPPQTILAVKDGVSLAAGDVNADHNPDIYVVGGRTGTTNTPDYLLLGNASGGLHHQGGPGDNHRPWRQRLRTRLQPRRPYRLPRAQRPRPLPRPNPAPYPPGHAKPAAQLPILTLSMNDIQAAPSKTSTGPWPASFESRTPTRP